MKNFHIGKKIQNVKDAKGISTSEFARQLSFTRDAVYKIFKQESIKSDRIFKISLILNHDFFAYFSEQLVPKRRVNKQ
jgi:transcriptional regulator with XRE-family HTH domain